MFKNMKISIKILLVIIVMSLGALLMVFGASYYFMTSMVDEFRQTNITLGVNSSNNSKDSLLSQAEDYLLRLVQKQSQAANEELYAINRIVTESAGYTNSLYVNNQYFTGKDMPRPDETEAGVTSSKYFLAKGVEATPKVVKEVNNLSSCEYLFAQFLDNNSTLDNIYIGTETGISYRYSKSNLFNPDYDPRERDWYKAAMAQEDTLVWLPTYEDSYGNTCITAAMSYRDDFGRTTGVVASDVLLTSIIDDVMGLKIGETGSCFMIDADHAFIAHPDMTNEDFNYDLAGHFEDDTFINALNSSDSGILETMYEGKDCYLAFSTLEETGWIFCASIETEEVTAPAQKARAESDQLTEVSQRGMQDKLSAIFRLFMIFFAIVGIVVIMISFAVSGTITRPIQRLTSSVKEIGEGNFNKKIPVESGDEVGELAEKFNDMQDNLKRYMENIKNNPLVKKLGFNRIILVCVLILMYFLFSLGSGRMLGSGDIKNALNMVDYLGFLALGVTFVIATGGIDFSIGPVMFCCALMAGYTMNTYGAPVIVSIIMSISSWVTVNIWEATVKGPRAQTIYTSSP